MNKSINKPIINQPFALSNQIELTSRIFVKRNNWIRQQLTKFDKRRLFTLFAARRCHIQSWNRLINQSINTRTFHAFDNQRKCLRFSRISILIGFIIKFENQEHSFWERLPAERHGELPRHVIAVQRAGLNPERGDYTTRLQKRTSSSSGSRPRAWFRQYNSAVRVAWARLGCPGRDRARPICAGGRRMRSGCQSID